MKWVSWTFVFVFLFMGYAIYHHISDTVYYIWDKTKDVLLFGTITTLLIRLYEHKFVIRVFQFSTSFLACRSGVEFMVLAFPELDTPAIINFLFIFSWITVLYIIFYKSITICLFKARIYWNCLLYWCMHRKQKT